MRGRPKQKLRICNKCDRKFRNDFLHQCNECNRENLREVTYKVYCVGMLANSGGRVVRKPLGMM